MELIKIALLVILVFVFGGILIRGIFFTSDYDKCYSEMENCGIAVFGSCCGITDEDKCIDCPYFVCIDKDGELLK